jgi:predicted P-loop ATPase
MSAPLTTTTLTRVGSRFLISAVARIYRPGCKADYALILEGRQGLGKSTALRVLFDGDDRGWFTDEIADIGSKDSAIQLRGAWIVELAELDAMKRADVSRLKAFISRTNDRYRPPYGRTVVDVPRQCVFAGSVNDDEYLRDSTGGRRFWPVKCADEKCDVRGLHQAREQIWAEAVARYRTPGTIWYLREEDLAAAAAEEQADRQQQHPWLERISAWLRDNPSTEDGVTVGTILSEALGKRTENWTDGDKVQVGKCMATLRALGWEKGQKRVEGSIDREYRYFKTP